MTRTIVLAIRANAGLMWESWEPAIDLLHDAGVDVVDARSPDPVETERIRELATNADGLIVGLERVDASVIAAAKHLKFIGKPGAGVDNIDIATATERGILVCNTAGSNAEAVADHTFGLILATLRHIVPLDATTRAGRGWQTYPAVVGGELWQKTIGIVGTGSIGRAVARRARGFDLGILGYDVAPDKDFARDVGLTYVPMDELLQRSDVVTVHVPLLPQTRSLFDAKQFDRMKAGALFFNLSRGGVVDEEALTAALHTGHLAGAGLDVFESEPLPASSPLTDLENVVLTPHVAGFSEEAVLKSRIWIAEAARDALTGKVPKTVVNTDVIL